jgi:putative Holliday junction resolvase
MADERLSSIEAKQLARAEGHRGDFGRRPVDSRAAELILQTWFAERCRRRG